MLFVSPYFCIVIIKMDMVMKAKKKFTWIVEFYNVKSGDIDFRLYRDVTVDDVNWYVDTFLEGSSDYVVDIFKYYRRK